MGEDRDPERDPADPAARLLRRFVGLQELSAALAATVDRERIGALLLRDGPPLVGARAAVVYVGGDGELELLGAAGYAPEVLEEFARLPIDLAAPLAEAARRREELWFEGRDPIDRRYPHLAPLRARLGIGSWVALPLVAGDRLQGVLGFGFDGDVRLDEADRALARSLAAQCAQALERGRLFAAQVGLREEAERAAERERRGAERLAESNALLDALIEATPVGLVFHDRELRVVRMNPALGRMIGQPPEACIGLRVTEIPGMANAEDLHAWLAEGLRAEGPSGAREVIASGSGQVRVLLADLFPVDDDDRIGVAAAVRDVTDERRAEAFRRHVLGIVGHDLRTPLTAIELSASRLRRRSGLPEADGIALDRIRGSVRRMEAIIRDLLDFARVSAGAAVPLATREADLEEICRAVVDEARAAYPGRVVELEGDGEARGVWDPDRLGQALGNLVSNALQHGRPDRPVKVRWCGDGAEAVLEVENEGDPIPPEVLERIFEPFRGGARTRQAGGGLGLGLFIARELVTAHAGALAARSAGGLTAFAIRLPWRVPG
jgi:PAS domain S-box-containing protein